MQKEQVCSDCRHNPEAKKPYAKMKRIPFTKTERRQIDKNAAKEGKTPNCFVCGTVLDFIRAIEH